MQKNKIEFIVIMKFAYQTKRLDDDQTTPFKL